MNRDAQKDRDMKARAVRRYRDRVMREVLAGDRPWSSIPRVNTKRRVKLNAKNFGDKADWIRAQPCEVTGRTRAGGDIIDPAHMVKRSRQPNQELVPLWRVVHTDFDDGLLSDEAFMRRWGRTRESIRATAPRYHDTWTMED